MRSEVRKLFLVIRDLNRRFCVTREELELLIDIRALTIPFYVILRRESSKWLLSLLSRVTQVCDLQYEALT